MMRTVVLTGAALALPTRTLDGGMRWSNCGMRCDAGWAGGRARQGQAGQAGFNERPCSLPPPLHSAATPPPCLQLCSTMQRASGERLMLTLDAHAGRKREHQPGRRQRHRRDGGDDNGSGHEVPGLLEECKGQEVSALARLATCSTTLVLVTDQTAVAAQLQPTSSPFPTRYARPVDTLPRPTTTTPLTSSHRMPSPSTTKPSSYHSPWISSRPN